MGTITQFHFKFKLTRQTPSDITEVFDLIDAFKNPLSEDYTSIIESKKNHPFFICERWASLFMENFFHKKKPSILMNPSGNLKIELHGELKNYDSELDKFTDWIKPYIKGRKKKIYLGWSKSDIEISTPQRHYWYIPATKEITTLKPK